ncbi:transcription factor bHLH130 isoform X1 [Cucumis sativus]|uniref:transcription factor bHLH130 isoform X1 n=1 Tax=Cucumis sativus TaxID=3659 RepID=UPI0005EC1D47|nr:transcription factor bHLH130 isoform X1 [Cucumis sativus]
MSLLYSTNFKFSNDEMKKYPDFMDCDSTNNHHSQQEHNNSGGLMRYCSAPTSLFASLVDGTEGFNSSNNGGGTREDYRFIRSSSPEVEVILSRFMASCNGKFDSGSGERTVKEETGEPVQQQNGFCNQPSSMVNTRSVDAGGRAPVGNSYGVMNSSDFDNSMQSQLGARNCSNLFRQSSSPAGFFSHLIAENGNTTREVDKFGTCNRKDVDAAYPSTRIGSQMNLSGHSFGSNHMPPIAEEENKSIGIVGSSRHRQKANSGDRLQTDDFLNSSWDNSAMRDTKRGRDNNGRAFATSIVLETQQNADSGNNIRGLAHHLSLPISFNKDPVEKFLRFQEPVPHQIRAKRGCATHPRSIAERMRRTRISERIKKLQELFPDMDKQTSTADMLELAVEYIKGLQRQVKTLTDTKAKCTCSCSSQ